ncbi:MAG: septum formation initiator family protein [Pseudomonadota bacterium]|nr:septum formation initiator family protein [Pseudomonadota bacterium]|tara:strand:+ start:468 stop:746 length:279 start_codon:yes stop_codon:yes gene_type:complete
MNKIIVILFLVFLYLQFKFWGYGYDSGFPRLLDLKERIENITISNSEQKEKIFILNEEVKDLKQGLNVIEGKARSELGLIKKDETFFQIIEK